MYGEAAAAHPFCRLWSNPMTSFSDQHANPRRSSLESPSNLGTLPSPAPSRGLPPTELMAHLVIALSKYHRLLRMNGGRVPAEIEDLVLVLTDRAGGLHPVPLLDHCRAAAASSVMPRRLLVTKSEAAEQLCVSLRTLERLISAGRLPLVHVEGAARVRVADLEAYVQRLEAGKPNLAPPDGPCQDNASKDGGSSPNQASASGPAVRQ
jgi:excisionase family DNA binding protein